jgi:glycosyltransferase involved in cell wall biosynthesis
MIPKQQKLLIIIPLFPRNIKEDTVVPFLAQFFNFFDENYPDLEIHICSLNYPFKKTTYSYNGITVHTFGNGFENKLKTIVSFVQNIFGLLRLQRKYKFNAILSIWYHKSAILGKIIANLFGLRHVTWLQGQDVKKDNNYLKFFSTKKDRLLTVSTIHKQRLAGNFKNKRIEVANVAIIPKGFPNLNTSLRTYDIIGVGNLSKLKNFSLFIDVISELKKSNPNIKAVICGGGEEIDILSKKIIKLGLSEHVRLMGYRKNSEVRDLLNNSKAYLHTSHFEGNSYAIQEALYSGCQVVSTIAIEKKINNFYHTTDKTQMIEKLNENLNNFNPKINRERIYDPSETAQVIYKSLFESID